MESTDKKKLVSAKLAPEKKSGESYGRRSVLELALAGGAASAVGSFSILRDAFAKESGPIVIGHHCELTGGFSSWGWWHDKCAREAVNIINEGGGIAGRKLQLAVADTESNPATGARSLQSLIGREGASFVVGSVHSGVMLASIPVATEKKVPYFSCGEATEATGSRGSRYSFRTGTDTYALAAAGVPWAMENLGKKWTTIFPDYAWGYSHHEEHRKLIEAAGGTVNHPIAVPLRTTDLAPYLAKIPEDTEVLFSVFFGAMSTAFFSQAKLMRLDERMKMYSVSGTVEAIDPRNLDGAIDGVHFLENFPRPVAFKNDAHHKNFVKVMNIDPVYAKQNDGERVMAKSHAWQSWENIFLLKEVIEKAGWQRHKDTPGVIEALEGFEMLNSDQYPQGNKLIRAEDHSGQVDCYISQVVNSKFELRKHIPREETTANLPLRFDFRREKFAS